MAIVVNSDASAFKRTANLPSSTSYTMWGWFMLTTDRNTFSGLLGIANAVDGASFQQLGTDSDGTTLKIWNASTSTTVAAMSTNTWYFGAITCAGTGAGQFIGYLRAITANTFTTASLAGTSFTPGSTEWGRDCVTGEFITGRIHACGMADAVLSADELLELSYFHEPQLDGIRSLNVFYPTIVSVNTDATTDKSGNGRNATATVGALADSPPLLWASRGPQIMVPSGVTNIDGTLAQTLGALVSAGAGAVDVAGTLDKTLGSLVSSGAGAVNIDGSLAQTLGALTVAGVGSVGDNIDGSLAKTLGALTSSGAGAVNVDGQGAVTLGALTSVGAGAVNVDGSLAKTLGQLVVAAVGDNGDVGPPPGASGYQTIEWRRRGRR